MFIYKRCEFLPDRANFLAIPDDARVELMRLPSGLCERADGEFLEIDSLQTYVLNGRRAIMTSEGMDLEGAGRKDAVIMEFTAQPLFEDIAGEYEPVDIAEMAEYAADGFILPRRDEWLYYSLFDPEIMDDTSQWDEITNVEGFHFEPDAISFTEPYRFFADKKAVERFFMAGKV